MLAQLRPALVILVALTLITGLGYPLLVTGIAGLAMPEAASGSLLRRPDGTVLGSRLIGQGFTQPGYFHGRPSAAGTDGWDAAASSGSNLGPTSQALVDRVKAAVAALREEGVTGPIPVELVTTSASGLDPELSPEAALVQVPRIAAARNLPAAEIEALVDAGTQHPVFGFIGTARVDILELNLALDGRQPPR